MHIDLKGRNVEVTPELRAAVEKRFARLGRQVPDVARVEVVLTEERNPAIADGKVAEASLHVKGVTLHAREASPEILRSIKVLAEDMRRQVKRHRSKRVKRSQTRRLVNRLRGREA